MKDNFYGVDVEYPITGLLDKDGLLHKFIKNDYFVMYCKIIEMSKSADGWFEATEQSRTILCEHLKKSDIAVKKILAWMVEVELLIKSKRGWYKVNPKYLRYV